MKLRLTDAAVIKNPLGKEFDRTFALRMQEADEYYATVIPKDISADAKLVMRQSFGGLLWSKQFYHYVVKDWLEGDSATPPPPANRDNGRNSDWAHLYNADVLSMPPKRIDNPSKICTADRRT